MNIVLSDDDLRSAVRLWARSRMNARIRHELSYVAHITRRGNNSLANVDIMPKIGADGIPVLTDIVEETAI